MLWTWRGFIKEANFIPRQPNLEAMDERIHNKNSMEWGVMFICMCINVTKQSLIFMLRALLVAGMTKKSGTKQMKNTS